MDSQRTSWLGGSVFPAPSYPTPLSEWPELGNARAELWLKNDGLSHAVYGGSKVRKAERLVAEAVTRGALRVLSLGAAGSHHLLTLTLFARSAGLSSAGLLIPQPRSADAVETLRAALGLGLDAHAVQHPGLLPVTLARTLRARDYVIPPGGSNTLGARACADAVDELALQISAGGLPVPDWIVVPLGSGGTCAGIAAGVVRRGWPCRVLGVQVVRGFAPRAAARWLARAVLRSSGYAERVTQLDTQLVFDAEHVGPGYGTASAAGLRARAIAGEFGLALDQTYTAKAFAKVLQLLDRPPASAHGRKTRVLYWHTLAANSLAPLLARVPSEAELPAPLRRLFR